MFIHVYETEADRRGFQEKWYTAAFSTQKEHRREITRWCYKHFGEPGYRPLTDEIRWKDGIQFGEVIFSRPADLQWFILKWTS